MNENARKAFNAGGDREAAMWVREAAQQMDGLEATAFLVAIWQDRGIDAWDDVTLSDLNDVDVCEVFRQAGMGLDAAEEEALHTLKDDQFAGSLADLLSIAVLVS